MDAVTKNIHRGRWRLLCHILWFLSRILHGRGYTTLAAELYRLTIDDLETLKAWLYHQITGGALTSDNLVERLIHMASQTSRGSPQRGIFPQVILQMLNNGTHPPKVETTNIAPSLAGTFYLPFYRKELLPSHQPNLPCAERVFDLLMARDAMRREHQSQLSSVLVHLASVIELDAFETPSLDLSPLYGRSETAQFSMRRFRDGLLKTDCFASRQAALLPPGVGVLLVMFNRYHNYVAARLQAINESGRFTVPEASRPGTPRAGARARQDEAHFQTARRITCGLYGNIIVHDYLRTLLGLNESGSDYTVDPRVQGSPSEAPVSLSASLQPCVLGFWKSMVSERDDEWIERHFRASAGEAEAATAASARARQALEKERPSQPEAWLFGEHERGEDGALPEEALAAELTASVGAVASAYGSRRTPWAFRATEVRALGHCRPLTLNAYRAGLGLGRHATWTALHAPENVARTLRALYEDPAAVDLQAGLLAEQQAPQRHGANVATGGLAGGPTMNRALLRDTVALLRGSPRLADALDPAVVTRWGSREVASDPLVAHGGVMHKLILRALPRSFAPNSIYVHFPLVVPARNRAILARNRAILARLAEDGPYGLAAPIPPPLPPSGAALPRNPGPGTYCFARQHAQLVNRLPGDTHRDTQNLVGKLVQDLARQRGAGAIDLVRDAARPVLVRLYCRLFRIEMAEGAQSQNGSMTEADVWGALSSAYDAEVHHEPASAFGREKRAHGAVELLRGRIREAQRGREETTWMERTWGRWADSGDVDHSLCPLIRAMAVQVGAVCHVLAESVEYFITDGTAQRPRSWSRSSRDDSAASDPQALDGVLGYMLEGFRLAAMLNGRAYRRRSHGTAPALVDISATASDPAVFPRAGRFQPDRPLSAYGALGLGDLATACPVVQAALGIFTAVLRLPGLRRDAAQPAPRRVTLPFPPGLDGSDTEPRRGGGLGGEAFAVVEDVRDAAESDWMVVWDDEDEMDGARGATMYLSDDQGQVCAVPRSLPLTWDGEWSG